MQTRLSPRPRSRSIAATSIAFLVFLGLGAGRRAHAQSAEAEALFNEGGKLMSDGKLAQACDAFEASNRVEPRAGTLIRLGECRERNQQLASAWSAYKDALTRVKDPRKREVATAKAASLESRLSYLTVSVSDESRVPGLTLMRNDRPLDPMLWNRGLPVDGGDYVIVGRAPGQEEWQTTVHVPHEGAKVSVEVPKFKELGKVAAMPPATPPRHPDVGSATDHDVLRPSGLFTTRRKIAFGVFGAAAIVAVTGAVFGESAKGQQSEAYRRCAEPATPCTQADQAEALIESGQRRALVANVAFGVAAAGAIGAGVLWLTGGRSAERVIGVNVIPRVTPDQTGIAVSGTF